MQFRETTPFNEVLEDRIAPAALLTAESSEAPHLESASEIRFRDADGDYVSVKFSEEILTADNWQNVFSFEEAGVGSRLTGIDLTKMALTSKELRGIGISVEVTDAFEVSGSTPNHRADVGFLNAEGIDLGDVSVAGNLERIVAGDSKLGTAGLGSLKVLSLGATGDVSSAEPGDFTSVVHGAIASLDVAQNVTGAVLRIDGGKKGVLKAGHIGGSVIGNDLATSGSIYAEGAIFKLEITGRLQGGVGEHSGSIHADKIVDVLNISGGIVGGDGNNSGRVEVSGNVGSLISAPLVGGAGKSSGTIWLDGNAQHVSVTSLYSGSSQFTGYVNIGGSVNALTIGNIFGGNSNNTGSVYIGKNVGQASVGALNGGAGNDSGAFNVRGNVGDIITGSLTGSTGNNSGVLFVNGNISDLQIIGELYGGTGNKSGEVYCKKSIKQIEHIGGHSGHGDITRYVRGKEAAGWGPGYQGFYHPPYLGGGTPIGAGGSGISIGAGSQWG
jgi:hypothetical protein